MPSSLDVRDGTRGWATLDLAHVRGEGRLNPRLMLTFAARPASGVEVVLDDVTLRLTLGKELIGQGRVVDIRIAYDRASVEFELPVSARLLRYATHTLSPTSTVVDFAAQLQGPARARLTREASGHSLTVEADAPSGDWVALTLGRDGQPSLLQVPRTEWYERVLSPTRNERYRYLEIALPRDDQMFDAEWSSAVRLLDQAERVYAAGDDPAVFLHLRGALEALPGAMQHILDGITDTKKRQHLNALLKDASTFLHAGRHVTASGTQAGTFAVTRTDAAFALDLVRILLSHMSLLLTLDRA